MKPSIKIELKDTNALADSFLHRFRNFGEEVWAELKSNCSVSLEEIDSCTDSFCIRNINRKDLGTTSAMVKKLLKRHNLTDDVKVIRLDNPDLLK
jgi:hypothetical protein